MDLSDADPAVAAFVVMPLLLVGALVWGAHAAWRRGGAAPAAARRTAILVGVAGLAWLAATWSIAASGVLRAWDRRPPPFALFVLALVAVALAIAWSGLGRQLARHLPLWVLVASRRSDSRSSSPCTRWPSAASCRSR